MDMKTNAWEKLEVKPKPTARSGHRMTQWKNFLVMFGGFYDNYVDTRYYDDLWVFDTLDYKWIKVELPDQMIRPAARSGFSFIPCNEGVILYGGYCKEYTKGQRPKGIVHTDTWLLKMNTDPKLIRWEKKKKSGSAPSARSGCAMAPYKNRAVLFGGVFDDDVNEETLESTFYNELYTYQIDTGRWFPMNLKRPKTAKKKKSRKGNKQAGRAAGADGQDGADEEGSGKREKMKWEESTDDEFDYGDFEDSENEGDDATTGTAEGSVAGTEEQPGTPKDGGDLSGVATPQEGDDEGKDPAVEKMTSKEALAAAALAAAGILPKAAQTSEPAAESASTKKSSKSGRNARDNNNNNAADDDDEEEEPLMPCPRYNPMLAVQKSTLFIFGGILEVRDREYTLDDFFSLNLDKMTEYICLRQSEFESQLWLGEESDDEEEGDEDDDDDDEDEEEDEDDEDDDEDEDEKEDEEGEATAAESSQKDKKSKKDGKDKSEKKEKKDKKEKKEKKDKKDKKDKAATEPTPSAGSSDPTATDAAAAEAAAEGTGTGTPAEGEGAAAAEEVVEVVPSQLSGVDLAARLAMTEEETASTPTIGETLKEFYGRTSTYPDVY